MNFAETSDYIFENAEKLIAENKVFVGLYDVSTNTKKLHCSILVLRPFNNNGKPSYRLIPMVRKKFKQVLRYRDCQSFVITEARQKNVAKLQPASVANLNYFEFNNGQIEGRSAEEIAEKLAERLRSLETEQ